MDTTNIQKDFPTLSRGTDLHYLDTAATSLTPEPVLSVMDEYYRDCRASVHRGLYKEAEKATEVYESAREGVAKFIGASKDEVIFTSGATASANMLIYALEHTLELREGDEIVTTVMEHHAILLPLQQLAKRKRLVLKYAQMTKDFMLDAEDLQELTTDRTKIVAVTAASNVTGSIIDVVNQRLYDDEAPVVIRDATALVGHAPIDVSVLDADFVFFSGHKMCGPTGIGVLWGKKKWLEVLEPGFFGGGMVDDVMLTDAVWSRLPEKLEPGTQNIAGVVGLGAAIKYLGDLGVNNIHSHTQELVTYAQEKLHAAGGVTLYAAPAEHNVGIVSFTVEGVHPHDVADILGKNNVAVRAGHHCALPLHKELDAPATVRASFYLYNTKEDVEALVGAVQEAQKIFSRK